MNILEIALDKTGKLTLKLGTYTCTINTNKPIDNAPFLPWTENVNGGINILYTKDDGVPIRTGNPEIYKPGIDHDAIKDDPKRPKKDHTKE